MSSRTRVVLRVKDLLFCKKADSRSRPLTPFESLTSEEFHNFEFFGKLFSCALTDAELRNRQTAAFSFMLKF